AFYHGAAMYIILLSILSITWARPQHFKSTVALGSPATMGSDAIMALRRQLPTTDSEMSLSPAAFQGVLNRVFPDLQGGARGLLAADINQQNTQRLDAVSVSSLTDINGTLALAAQHNLPVLVVYTREELREAARGRSFTAQAALQRLTSPTQKSNNNDEDDSDENNEVDM
ncbi:unnamed protein product, partial [Meganyctiphanes norvegica]